MIKILFIRNQQEKIIRFMASGHADMAMRGEDILCAAVSALLQGAVVGLENYSQPKVEKRDEEGFIDAWVGKPKKPNQLESVQAIVETLLLSLRRIEKDHPNHLVIIEQKTGINGGISNSVS